MQFEIIIMITANGRVSPGLQTSAFGCGSAIGVRGTTCGFKVLEVQPKSEAVMKKKTISKRELIAPRGDKRYIRRDEGGRIKENDDVSHSLSQ